MDKLRTNTRKVDYHISVKRGDKLEQTFVAHTDSVCNALKSAYEQCCGWTRTPVEPLVEPDTIQHVGYNKEQLGYDK